MAEEEKTENENEQPEAEEPQADQPAAEEAPAEEPAAEEAAAEEPAAEEPSAEEPSEQPATDPAAPGGEAEEAAGSDVAEGRVSGESGGEADAAAGSDVEPEARPGPKEIRRRKRSQASGPPGPERSSEERAAERIERRRAAAARRRRYRQGQRAKLEKAGAPKGTGTPPADREAADRKLRQGKVISSKGDKTITVKVEQVGRHRRYEKVVRHSRTMHAHDEANQASEGDIVRIVETRPLSRSKRWRLVDIVERAR